MRNHLLRTPLSTQLVNFALFDRQVEFYEFKVEDADATKWGCLISAVV